MVRHVKDQAPGPVLSRRQVLAAAGAGGLLLALGGVTACDPPPGDPAGPPVRRSSGGRLDVTLVAAAGTVPWGTGTRAAYTYNGGTPGPTLVARPGDLVAVTLENRLDTDTNLHAHGLHVSPAGDGDNPFVMVPPGGMRTYRYAIPPDHPSGTFWYHAHHHGHVAEQVAGGLVGALVVQDAVDQLPALAGATDRVLVLHDPPLVDTAAALAAPVTMMTAMQGRTGPSLLVNGWLRPAYTARVGSFELWRFINAGATRTYRLQLDVPWYLIATDQGRLDRPVAAGEVVLAPGERAEVLVPVTAAGTATLATAGTVLATFTATGSAAPPALPATLGAVAAPPATVDRTRDVVLAMAMMGGGMMGGGMMGGSFTIDGRTFDPNRVDIAVPYGTTEEWTLRNTSTMDHPFHLHTWPFRVMALSTGGAVPAGWKDTVNVPAGGWVRIRIPFTGVAGRSVYHCHILDHEDQGMMGVIEVA